MVVGLDLIEAEFDRINAEKSELIRNAPDFNDELFTTYANKNCPTEKGFWLQIVEGYEKYFTIEEIVEAVPYIPKDEEETYEI
jgi:hypothetical protein